MNLVDIMFVCVNIMADFDSATTLPSQHDKNERKMTFHHYHQICPKN